MTDRELDALVAEKVMALKIHSHTWPCGVMPDTGAYEAATLQNRDGFPMLHNDPGPVYLDKNGKLVEPVPFYSTDIAAAWQVVEKMGEDGWGIRIQGPNSYTDEGLGPQESEWLAHFGRQDDSRYGYSQGCRFEKDSLPRAICLAALQAKDVEVTP